MADLVTPKGRTMEYLQGSPYALADEVSRLKSVAGTIDQLTELLGRISDGEGSQADKIDTIRETSGEAKLALERARDLYNSTGWALGEYQSQLQTSVTNAQAAYDGAVALLPWVNASETAVYNAQVKYNNLINGTPVPDPDLTAEENATAQSDKEGDALDVLNAEKGTLAARQLSLHNYKVNWDTAKDDLDEAAEVARGRIQTAVDTNPGKDGDWDDFWAFVDGLADVLGWIILALTIVALFLSGPILAAVLLVILVLSVVSLIAHLAQAVMNKGSWVDVGLDLVGLIPFGRLFTTAGKLGPRLAATFGGIFDITPPFRPAQIAQAREAVEFAIRENPLSMAGNLIQTRADDAIRFVGESGNTFIQSLLKGGDETMATFGSILDNLPGYNANARAAIDYASGFVNDTGVAVDSIYDAVVELGSAVNTGSQVLAGDDWAVNALVDGLTADPTASDLKSRIMAPDTLVAAGTTENPYD